MGKIGKKRSRPMNPWLSAVLNGFLCAAVSAALALLLAKLITSGALPVSMRVVYAYVITGLSALAGCAVTARRAEKQKLPLSFVTGASYLLLLDISNGILQKGEFQRLLPTMAVVLGCALLCGLLGARKRQRKYT